MASQHFITRKRKLVLWMIFSLFDCQKTNGLSHVESHMTMGQTSAVLDE